MDSLTQPMFDLPGIETLIGETSSLELILQRSSFHLSDVKNLVIEGTDKKDLSTALTIIDQISQLIVLEKFII